MLKCDICGEVLDGDPRLPSITGSLNGKTMTMCFPCFNKDYELKRPAKVNIFQRRTKS